MPKPVDLSKSLAALDQDSTLIVVIEMSQSSWLVAARAPGLARDPLKNRVRGAGDWPHRYARVALCFSK